MKRIVSTDAAPAALGAYSQGATDGSLLFTAQVALTPGGGSLTDAGVATQTERALGNVLAVLSAEGASADALPNGAAVEVEAIASVA